MSIQITLHTGFPLLWWRMNTHTHTHSHACLLQQILRSITTPDLHTQTPTHTLLPHPPPGLIHLLHLRMHPLWCHLQSYHFKGTKAPRCHQHKEQTHRLASSFVLLSPNGDSPAESPYTVKGELHSVLCNQVFLGFCPLALTVHHCNNDKLSLFLFPPSDMKETVLARRFVCTYMCLLWVYELVHL